MLAAYVGERRNRRHKPGRAFERTSLPLRRARPTTAPSATCSATACSRSSGSSSPRAHGYVRPGGRRSRPGLATAWREAMERSAPRSTTELVEAGLPATAPYAVPLAYRVRFVDADERPRGHAPARAAHRAAGPPRVPRGSARRCTASSPSRPVTAPSRRRCASSTTSRWRSSGSRPSPAPSARGTRAAERAGRPG